jgi:transcriptional regulator with XRE-family HTH domain
MYSRYCELRRQKGVNDFTVARETGIPASTLYDWGQRDAQEPGAKTGVDNLMKLAAYFGVTIDYFVRGVDARA